MIQNRYVHYEAKVSRWVYYTREVLSVLDTLMKSHNVQPDDLRGESLMVAIAVAV